MSATFTAAGHAVDEVFLAADVGGTHARVALVRVDARGAIEVLDQHAYDCAAFSGLAPILADFLGTRGVAVADAAIACAGVVRGDDVLDANLPWRVSLAELRALGIARVAVVNDFVAVAHAVQCLDDANTTLLTPGVATAESGPTLVVGPGTGLGAALRVPHGGGTLVLAAEAGHAAFAPGDARELAVLRRLLAETAHVDNERLLSGPGLARLYRVLCELDGVPAQPLQPAQVPDAARRGEPHALEAVQRFCALLGSLLGDLVLTYGASRVFVAGGILCKLQDFLAASDFHARFVNKGVLRPLLEKTPVRLIVHPHRGVIGAASWYVQRER